MKRILLLLLVPLIFFTGVRAQALSSFIKEVVSRNPDLQKVFTDEPTILDAREAVVDEDFDRALYIYGLIIEQQKQHRQQGTQVSNEVLAEYAYVLALTGVQEAALINIDLAINLKSPSATIYYYVGSILDIIGFGNISKPFNRYGKQPAWLQGRGNELKKKYKAPILIRMERADAAILHISSCVSDSRMIEALCYSDYLVQLVPDMQTAWLLQSAVYEKLGCFASALESYEKGLALSSEGDSLPGMAKQWAYLKKKSENTGDVLSVGHCSKIGYVGITFNDGNSAINGRYGYSNGSFSASFSENLGVTKNGDVSVYLGLSMYHNISKFFYGLGMGWQTNGDTNTFSLSPTIGFSFLNSKRTSSLDISFGYNIPCKSGVSSTIEISIGKTIYFNSKSKGKSK